MEDEDFKQLLLDYAATANNPQYNGDWDVIDAKFPELEKYDRNLLHDYVATYNNPEYQQDVDVVNAKFPELFPVKKKRRVTDRTFRISFGWGGNFCGITVDFGGSTYRCGISRT
jgi:hypothetical protein